jgi:hypothetical protein
LERQRVSFDSPSRRSSLRNELSRNQRKGIDREHGEFAFRKMNIFRGAPLALEATFARLTEQTPAYGWFPGPVHDEGSPLSKTTARPTPAVRQPGARFARRRFRIM